MFILIRLIVFWVVLPLVVIAVLGRILYIYLHSEQETAVKKGKYELAWNQVFKEEREESPFLEVFILFLLLIFSTLASFFVRIMAPGILLFMAGLFIVVTPLLIHWITHVIAITRVRRAKNTLFAMIVTSHIFLFVFFITQPEGNDMHKPAYSVLSVILLKLLDREIILPNIVTSGSFSLIFGAFLFFSWIAIHLPWFYKKSNRPKSLT